MKCMADSKENEHWDLGSERVNVSFRLLETSVGVLEKSWKSPGNLFLQKDANPVMGYLNGHPWRVIRTRNLCYQGKFWSREMKFSSSQQGIRVIWVRVKWVKMTEKWGQIQGKWDLVWVSGGVLVIRVRVIGVLL